MQLLVVKGMSVISTLGVTLRACYENFLARNSGIKTWRLYTDDPVYSRVGGDIYDYDIKTRFTSFAERLPETNFVRARKLRSEPWSARLSALTRIDAWLHSGLDFKSHMSSCATLLAGHSLNENYLLHNNKTLIQSKPDWIDAQAALLNLETDYPSSMTEVLGARGASTNIALRNAIDEIRYHGQDVAVTTGAARDFSPMDLHAMSLLSAITTQSFNETPQLASRSRPYGHRREGFVAKPKALATADSGLLFYPTMGTVTLLRG